MPALISVGNAATPGKTNPTGIAPTAGSTSVATSDTTIIDMTSTYLNVASWTISNPANAAGSVWVTYGGTAVVGQGIELPPGAFLYEDVFFGAVHGISAAAGAITVGWQKL